MLENIKGKLRPYLEEKKIIKGKDRNLQDEIKEAHQKWVNAQQYFNSVSEPELIDHASYLLQAARTKYMYLLDKVKKRKGQMLKKEE